MDPIQGPILGCNYRRFRVSTWPLSGFSLSLRSPSAALLPRRVTSKINGTPYFWAYGIRSLHPLCH